MIKERVSSWHRSKARKKNIKRKPTRKTEVKRLGARERLWKLYARALQEEYGQPDMV